MLERISPIFQKTSISLIILLLLSTFLYSQNLDLHGLEFRDDEVFYLKSTQEMVRDGNYLSPTYLGEHRWQKPILFYWLVIFSSKVFGAGWVGARMVSVIFGSLTVMLAWLIARELFNKRVAWLSSLILMTSPMFFRHAKGVVPDMALTFCIVWAIGCAIKFWRDPQAHPRYKIWFFVSCGLGFMIKGFTAIIFPFLTFIICALISRRGQLLKKINFPIGFLIMLAIIAPWFIYMIKTHGQAYLNYMLVDETQNRVVTNNGEWGPVIFIKNFLDHILFYLEVIGSYWAPWSLFAIAAVPFGCARFLKSEDDRPGLMWMLVWIGVVVVFYCSIYFSINHYMMALAVPLCILIGYFFLYPFEASGWGKFLHFFRTFFVSFIFVVSILAYTFVHVFLLGAHAAWFVPAVGFSVFMVVRNVKSRSLLAAPLTLALTLVFVFSQSHYLGEAGLTTHAPLQKFATTLSGENLDSYTLGVGSHDIHEKAFQIYFDTPIIKAAGEGDANTAGKLEKFFKENDRLYLLILENDFNKHLSGRLGEFEILREEYIFRKRVRLDDGFLLSLVRADQKTVRQYLMEKIILLRRN